MWEKPRANPQKSYPIPMKKILVALVALALVQSVRCAEMQTIVYPTADAPSFKITVPKDWEMKQAEEEGDYFHLLGPTGAVFSFRTIEGSENAMTDAIKRSMQQVDDDYKNVKMGDAQDWTPGGLKGFFVSGNAETKKEGDEVTIGMGWAALEDGKIAEFWFVADLDDKKGISAAENIANSLKAP
jgi:hypothetical protein